MSSPNRSHLTKLLLETLKTKYRYYSYDKPEGSDGGWTDDPGAAGSRYLSYGIINPMESSPSEGSIYDPTAIWTMHYSLENWGATGEQVERQSDMVRKLIGEMERKVVTLGGDPWAIMKVSTPSIGGVIKNGSTGALPVYSENDVVLVQISKE